MSTATQNEKRAHLSRPHIRGAITWSSAQFCAIMGSFNRVLCNGEQPHPQKRLRLHLLPVISAGLSHWVSCFLLLYQYFWLLFGSVRCSQSSVPPRPPNSRYADKGCRITSLRRCAPAHDSRQQNKKNTTSQSLKTVRTRKSAKQQRSKGVCGPERTSRLVASKTWSTRSSCRKSDDTPARSSAGPPAFTL
eukprot:3936643-Rhodomonas_salina.1